MLTRRFFIAAAAAVTSLVSGLPQALASTPKPKQTPAPKPAASSTSTKPSQLARELALSLQRDLPHAHLSDATTEKIASDIQDQFAIGKSFRKMASKHLPPPDFVFAASSEDRP